MVPGPVRRLVSTRGPSRGDRDGVLEMGRQRAVDGRDRPVVVVHVHVGPPAVIIGSIASVMPSTQLAGRGTGVTKFGTCGSSW